MFNCLHVLLELMFCVYFECFFFCCVWAYFVAFSFAVFGCNMVAQTELVKATTATENAVFVTMQWLAIVKPSSGLLYTIADELKSQVKKMGAFLQMLIQVKTKKPIKH